MKTKMLLGEESREALMRGMTMVKEPVARSMGAKGRNTVFTELGTTSITNDGITIARNINPEDSFEAQGVDLIRQASEQTNTEAGDGTSATIVLSHAIAELGMKEMKGGKNPMVIRKELEVAKDEAIGLLKDMSKPIKDNDLLDVAKISVEDDAIAQTVVDAVKKAGKYGAVMVEEGVGYSLEKVEEEGYFWNKGYISPYMITNAERMEAVLENPAVIMTDKHLNLNKELIGILNELHAKDEKSVLLIADNVEGELLQTLILNKMKGIMTVVAVRRPPTLEELEDIAIVVKGTAVTKDKGIKDFHMGHIGRAKKIVVKKDNIVIIGQESIELEERIKSLETSIKDNKDDEVLKKRMGMLASGIVKLSVGAKTEAERRYLRRKIEDCVCACNCAIEEGIVAGAGSTLRDISKKIDNQILKQAFKYPHKQILKNAGIEDDGDYNVLTGKKVKDYIKEGIIDPTKVVRVCISNAVSIASTFLTTECVIASIPEEKK